jgi:hypothetical protein
MAHLFDFKELLNSFRFGKKRYTKTPTPPRHLNLMNGVSQFTLKDLVIIHRVLSINLNILIYKYLYKYS